MICSHTAHKDHELKSLEEHLSFQRLAMKIERQKLEKQLIHSNVPETLERD
jgi:hypothetical protein